MITDYSRQATAYEAYRTSADTPDTPPALNFLTAPTNVQSFFVPFDKSVRGLLTRQTSGFLMREPQSVEDETDRYYAKNLVFAINSDTSINAFADYSKQGNYIISINAGLFAAMVLIFRRLFSHASIFPNVGPSTAESSTTATIRPIDHSIQDLSSFLAGMPRPQSRLRSDVADTCAMLATLFTVYHELRHVFGGHIDYQRKQYGAAGLREVGQTCPTGHPSDKRRAVEFDADKAAIVEIAHAALSLPPLAPPHGVEMNGAICAFAITTLFLVFDHERTSVDPSRHDHYPHPEVRAFQAFGAITCETIIGASPTGAFAIPNLATVPPPQLSEMIKEATKEASAVNSLLGRRIQNGAPAGEKSVGLRDVFPDQAAIRGQIEMIEGELQSLKSELQEAQAWARRQA